MVQAGRALHKHSPDSACRDAGPAIGDKRVSDHHSDARFDRRTLHRPDACFAKPVRTKRGAAAHMLSPRSMAGA
jgi:hypothetical protein